MRLEKAQIVQLLTNRGDPALVRRAGDQQPDLVDTQQHRGLRTALGVDVGHLDGSSDDELGGGDNSPADNRT